MNAEHVLVGFGFGPIQAGLFVREAALSGNFRRMVVAEIDAAVVDAVRKADSCYWLNVAHTNRIEHETVRGVELLNPSITAECDRLLDALAEATEVVTALPSVDLYEGGSCAPVAPLLAEGLRRGSERGRSVLVYTAENNNHAAEILADAVGR
ncbi:MAG: hypothetical protein N2255_07585, partial [Kiritimatiellae bacterium]|nr:hypothetical protein [Kiritimatiellia bacterium]